MIPAIIIALYIAILLVYPLMGAGTVIAILWVVGETVEHFTR